MAGVGDDNPREPAVEGQAHVDRATSLGEFQRVRQQIPDHLLQPILIAHDIRRPWIEVRAKGHALRVRGRHHHVHGCQHHLDDIDGPHLEPEFSRRNARHVEHVVDHPGLRGRVALDHVHRAVEQRPIDLPAGDQDSCPAEDRVERCANLVRERREEFVFGAERVLGHPARQLLRFDLSAQHALTRQTIAHVFDDGDSPDEDAGIVERADATALRHVSKAEIRIRGRQRDDVAMQRVSEDGDTAFEGALVVLLDFAIADIGIELEERSAKHL